jgi:repressor LexA
MSDRPALTETRRRVLVAIAALTEAKGYPPTVREIGTATGLRSSSTVHAHLRALVRHEWITHDPALPRTILVKEPPTT